MIKRLKFLLILILFHEPIVYAFEQNNKCYKIDNLEIQGAYNISNLKITNLQRKYKNTCLKAEDLKELIKVI